MSEKNNHDNIWFLAKQKNIREVKEISVKSILNYIGKSNIKTAE